MSRLGEIFPQPSSETWGLECVEAYASSERSFPMPWFGLGPPMPIHVAGASSTTGGRVRNGCDASLTHRLLSAASAQPSNAQLPRHAGL